MNDNYREIDGDLIKLALEGKFDVVVHGCNCFCRMKRGIAPQMAKAFACDKFLLEGQQYIGDINKLGQIDYSLFAIPYRGVSNGHTTNNVTKITVVNAYTQYLWQTELKPFDYVAFTLCMRKINHIFEGKHIGMPKIGSHLAGGDWDIIQRLIQAELKNCQVTVVNYKP